MKQFFLSFFLILLATGITLAESRIIFDSLEVLTAVDLPFDTDDCDGDTEEETEFQEQLEILAENLLISLPLAESSITLSDPPDLSDSFMPTFHVPPLS